MRTVSYWVDLGVLGVVELLVDYRATLVDREQGLWEIEVGHVTDNWHNELSNVLRQYLEGSAEFRDHVLDVERTANEMEDNFDDYVRTLMEAA